jgi:hypothetical protein
MCLRQPACWQRPPSLSASDHSPWPSFPPSADWPFSGSFPAFCSPGLRSSSRQPIRPVAPCLLSRGSFLWQGFFWFGAAAQLPTNRGWFRILRAISRFGAFAVFRTGRYPIRNPPGREPGSPTRRAAVSGRRHRAADNTQVPVFARTIFLSTVRQSRCSGCPRVRWFFALHAPCHSHAHAPRKADAPAAGRLQKSASQGVAREGLPAEQNRSGLYRFRRVVSRPCRTGRACGSSAGHARGPAGPAR